MTPLFLFNLAWKSSVVSGLALAFAKAYKHRAPTDRVLVLKIGVVCLLLFPLLAAILPATRLALPTLPASALEVARAEPSTRAINSAAAVPLENAGPALMSFLYQGGAALLILRFIVGIFLLAHWTRTARRVSSGFWRESLVRSCHDTHPPELLASRHISTPLSWGLFRPAILLDEQSLNDATSARAILAHELAHIRNRDWAALALARMAVALFWFNPLAWLLVRALEEQMEEAADHVAARQIGAADYAQILVLQGRRFTGSKVPALAMAAGPSRLSSRVGSLLRGQGSIAVFGARDKLTTATAAMITLPLIATLAFVSGRAASAPTEQLTPRPYPLIAAVPAAVPNASPTISLKEERRRQGGRTSTVVQVSTRQPSSAVREVQNPFDAAAQMDQQAAIVDDQASAVEAQARTLRAQSSDSGLSPTTRDQAQRQAATLETAAAAMRVSAAGTRANAIATRRNQALQSRLSQAP